ncbi:hypothetical protein JD276_15175 [Leucobacter sp. CSA1]|uniref:Uncharacterized protein n=1 Tax=Leucobacter chromiisoli TaxID=2796471 RepID=A0A934QAM0_9MICO|nr:hypothetical protein [Leucobacter chromiisoli]MBK0420370.1 hypothetical protein [Leucobacter chromiisoli]
MGEGRRDERGDARDTGGGSAWAPTLWALWPWAAWLLPVALVLMRLPSGGWETLILLFSAPLWWPVCALLALLPRFVLRRRGYRAMPTSVGLAMLGCFWGLLAVFASLRATGDSGSHDSPMRELLPWIPQRVEDITATLGAIVVLVSWIVAAVGAFVLPRSAGGGSAASSPRAGRDADPDAALPAAGTGPPARSGEGLLGIGLFAIPILLVLVVAGVDRVAMHGEADWAGEREVDVAGLSSREGAARQERHWEAAQEALQPARCAIDEAGWLTGTFGGVRVEDSGPEPHGYTVAVSWDSIVEGAPDEVGERVLAIVEGEGWRLHGEAGGTWGPIPEREVETDDDGSVNWVRYSLRNDRGYSLMLTAGLPEEPRYSSRPLPPPGSAIITLRVESGPYWLESRGNVDWDRGTPFAEAEPLWADDPPVVFACDEWPELRLVENQPLTVDPR